MQEKQLGKIRLHIFKGSKHNVNVKDLDKKQDNNSVVMKKKSNSKKKSNELSVIARDIHVVGKFLGFGALDVVGSFTGDVFADTVSIREGAFLNGSIVAKNITINGSVKGNLLCRYLAIGCKGVASGSFTYNNISIEDGGMIYGKCNNNVKTDEQIDDIISKAIEDSSPGNIRNDLDKSMSDIEKNAKDSASS